MNKRPILQSTIDKVDESLHVIESCHSFTTFFFGSATFCIVRLDFGNPTEHAGDPLDIGVFVVRAHGLGIATEVDIRIHGGTAF
eukprot:CAMPEP_0184424398 /NCGR_PEP_ID=MMETSP0738-20130409/109048_1 /TAXON_ID=385413 /ORGANISM="Thalassiosira miniscula, Strain CCMP1093" /LENGTH=83 /DNA_ID=CAMNT_0026786833 /DNA_START=208 /DNA_END=456 /DNA_ORIENTATION=+